MRLTSHALPKWYENKYPTNWATDQTDQVEVHEVGRIGVKAIKQPKLVITAKPAPRCAPLLNAIRLFGPKAKLIEKQAGTKTR